MSDERVGRIRFMDQQRVNLDGFAHVDVGLGLVAMDSPHDPSPSLVLRDGRVGRLLVHLHGSGSSWRGHGDRVC